MAVASYNPFDDQDEDAEGEERLDLATVEGYLDRIPAIEADALRLALLGCRQADIGVVIAPEPGPPLVQASVSYMIKLAKERVRALQWRESLDLSSERIRRSLSHADIHDGLDVRAVDIVVTYWETTCFRVTGDRWCSDYKGRAGHRAREVIRQVRLRLRRHLQAKRPRPGSVLPRILHWLDHQKPGVLHEQPRRPVEWRLAQRVPHQRPKF